MVFTIASGPFLGPSGSDFGASTSIHQNLAAIGSPLTRNGSITTYSVVEGLWIPKSQLAGDQQNGLFGASVEILFSKLLVGAPGVYANDTNTATGTAYFYEYLEGNTTATWQQVGSTLRGTENIAAVGEEFGASVGLSASLRVVIGAPNRNIGNGGVYTFDYKEKLGILDWTPLTPVPLNISDIGGGFGTSVAISQDGTRIIAGAPGVDKFFVYEWNGSQWILLLEETGNPGERLGSTVTFLSTSGDKFAVGAPGATGRRIRRALQGTSVGRVDIYIQETNTSGFTKLGPSIVGTPAGPLGASLAAEQSMSGTPPIFLGTSNGLVKRLDYNSDSKEWEQLYSTVSTGRHGQVTGLSAENGGSSFLAAVASFDTAAFYTAESGALSTAAPSLSSLVNSPVVPSALPLTTQSPLLTSRTSSPTPVPFSNTQTPSRLPPFPSLTPMTTGQPTQSTNVPSSSTPPPTSTQLHWTQLGSSFSGASNLGASVALSALVVAAGGSAGYGQVKTYAKSGGTYSEIEELNGDQNGSLFGGAVALNQQIFSLLVGAPGVFAPGTSTATGAAYVYTLDSNNANWTQFGSAIRGSSDIFAAGEAFGYSVALSNANTVAIGAPWSNADNLAKRGRVYTFKFDSSNSSWVSTQSGSPILGTYASDLLGAAVDISANGYTLLAGAPGQNSSTGAAMAYSWSSNRWLPLESISGQSSLEAFGTSVKILKSDGSLIAVGGPGYDAGRGVIRAYEIQSGAWVQLGSDIIGESGDALGGINSISGSDAVILAGTTSGAVKTFGYNTTLGDWEVLLPTVQTGLVSTPALSGSSSLLSFVAGSQNKVAIYTLI